jgi:excisionase family DNA binding protein
MDKLLTLQQLAELLGVPEATVYQWRSKGYGPRGLRVGKHVRYRPADVEKWLTSLAREVA